MPLLVRWPGRVSPGVSDATVNQIDLLASFAGLLGHEFADEQAIDSRDTMSAFLGDDAAGVLFMIEEARRLALRVGDWKFVQRRGKKGSAELYDLSDDVGEQRDLAVEQPERLAKMKAMLNALVTSERGVRGYR